MSLSSLVYVSVASSRTFDDNQLVEILRVSRENNQKLGITGMLLYRNGFFIQALEGEDNVVTPLYEKIKKDPRHRSILQIFKSPIKRRSFEEWSMGFRYLENIDLTCVEGFNDFLDKPFSTDFFSKNPSHAHTLLYSFKERSPHRI